MSLEPDPAEEIYAYHEGLDRGVWVARSALGQLGGQGWVEAEPPAAPAAAAEGAGEELVYAYHAGLHRSVWVARSALQQQLSLQGWVEAKPPPPRRLDADGALLPRESEPTAEPTEPTDDAPADAPADDAAPKRKQRARAAKTPEE